MILFADTADIAQLREIKDMGLLQGITTNPSIAARAGSKLLDVLAAIRDEFPGIPLFGQVVAEQLEDILQQARAIHAIGPNMVVKIPATMQGIKATATLCKEGIQTCPTAILTAPQALMAGLAGATYIGHYTGQNNKLGICGMEILKDICAIYPCEKTIGTQVVAASITLVRELIDAALAGAHIATAPYKIFLDAVNMPMPLTHHYIDAFYEDWTSAGCSFS